MRLKEVYISKYKNLVDFKLSFDGNSFIDVFVGKNGTGKSNLFEALIEIFQHLYKNTIKHNKPEFEYIYSIRYEINSITTSISWNGTTFEINGEVNRKTLGITPLPDNVLVYYSGHNTKVSDIIQSYEKSFKKDIKSASNNETRRFIGIGREYKKLLLAVFLMQGEDNNARQFFCNKLGILSIKPVVRLILKRPYFADKSYEIEEFIKSTHFWGALGITNEFLEMIAVCIKGEFKHGDIYNSRNDEYIIPINIELFRERFEDYSIQELFRQFDNLKTIEMFHDILISIIMDDGVEADINYFSDGQFQTVYIYSIIELFKDRNCITLLDEPDSFLHPEWQFDFLKMVFEITDNESSKNHVLMSSHSAVTLIPYDNKKIKFFDIKGNSTNCYDLPKHVAINKLSSDLIKYSEQEQLLSIINTIQIENKPVFFTEGSTDPIIIKQAWYKLYEEEIPFIPFYAFSCTYLSQLLTDQRILGEMNGLPLFGMFDFDLAYNQWNGINGEILENNPFKGLIKKWSSGNSYAIMIPVPRNPVIQKQVIKNATNMETFKDRSCCEIEHLFYGSITTESYFHEEPCVGGTQQVFKADSNKTEFAKSVIPLVEKEYFETFRPMFEFVKSKCTESKST